MTSKLVVNTIEADTGISSVSFASSISLSSTSKFFFGDAGIDIGPDTNINRPATGVLGFNINGTERVRINSSGRLGLGTDNPDTTLTIQSGGDAQMSLKNSSGTTKAYVGTAGAFGSAGTDDLRIRSDSSNIIFGFSGAERLRITSAGNVGINTNNPTARLEVNSGVIDSEKSAGWLDQYDAAGIRIFNNARSTLGIYTLEQGDWSSSTILGTIDGSVTRKWGIGMASNAKTTYASGLYIGYRTDNSSAGANTLNTMTHSLILPTTGDVRVNVGNLVIATNNKGIAFSGSTSSPDADSTSNTRLLSDYDEGTTVWELHRSDGLTTGSNHTTSKVTYTKIGNRVYMSGYVYTMSTGSSTGVTARLTDASGNAASLPYTPSHHGGMPIIHTRTIGEYERMSVSFSSGSKTVYVHTDEGYNSYEPNSNNVNISSPQTHLNIAFTGSYQTNE